MARGLGPGSMEGTDPVVFGRSSPGVARRTSNMFETRLVVATWRKPVRGGRRWDLSTVQYRQKRRSLDALKTSLSHSPIYPVCDSCLRRPKVGIGYANNLVFCGLRPK